MKTFLAIAALCLAVFSGLAQPIQRQYLTINTAPLNQLQFDTSVANNVAIKIGVPLTNMFALNSGTAPGIVVEDIVGLDSAHSIFTVLDILATPRLFVGGDGVTHVGGSLTAGATSLSGALSLNSVAYTASALLSTSAGKIAVSVPNTTGALTNDGAGNFGWFNSFSTGAGGAALPGTNQILAYTENTRSNAAYVLLGHGLGQSNALGSVELNGGTITMAGAPPLISATNAIVITNSTLGVSFKTPTNATATGFVLTSTDTVGDTAWQAPGGGSGLPGTNTVITYDSLSRTSALQMLAGDGVTYTDALSTIRFKAGEQLFGTNGQPGNILWKDPGSNQFINIGWWQAAGFPEGLAIQVSNPPNSASFSVTTNANVNTSGTISTTNGIISGATNVVLNTAVTGFTNSAVAPGIGGTNAILVNVQSTSGTLELYWKSGVGGQIVCGRPIVTNTLFSGWEQLKIPVNCGFVIRSGVGIRIDAAAE